MRKIFLAAALLANGLVSAVPIFTDVITIVDESGSMRTEHQWLSGMINGLDAELALAAGGDTFSPQYGLVGMGGYYSHKAGHGHEVNGGEFGTAAQFGEATSTLTVAGMTEDGYDGIDTALNYQRRSNALTNLILVTDEDRDILNTSLNYNNVLSALSLNNALLNAVVNVRFYCGDGTKALGVDYEGFGYRADGNGGFTKCNGVYEGYQYGTSIADYVNLALATGGAAWDLSQLRLGGLTATSFTNAFIHIKVKETIVNISEPFTTALFGLGLMLLGFFKRRTV